MNEPSPSQSQILSPHYPNTLANGRAIIYQDLIVHGATEASYPEDYQKYLRAIPVYKPPSGGPRRVGAALFLTVWVPIMALMEKITKAAIAWNGDDSGNAPGAVIWLVRTIVMLMWWHHDHLHAPLWGRGDGLDQGDGAADGQRVDLEKA